MKIIFQHCLMIFFTFLCHLKFSLSKIKEADIEEIKYIKPKIVEDIKHIDYYLNRGNNENKHNELKPFMESNNIETESNSYGKIKVQRKEDDVRKEDKKAEKSSQNIIQTIENKTPNIKKPEEKDNISKSKEEIDLELKAKRLEKQIKLLKIDLFGNENVSLDFYIKNKKVYSKEFLERVQAIVKLLDLVDEYNFLINNTVENIGEIIEEKGNKVDKLLNKEKAKEKTQEEQNEIFAYRRDNINRKFRINSNNIDINIDNKTIATSRDLNVKPPLSREKYAPLFPHDTIKEKNLITTNKDLKR